jgi:hypothetical protein
LGSVDDVPYSYTQQVKKEWWKYVISQYFPAYKPIEIDEWPAEMILEHLAICREIKNKTP